MKFYKVSESLLNNVFNGLVANREGFGIKEAYEGLKRFELKDEPVNNGVLDDVRNILLTYHEWLNESNQTYLHRYEETVDEYLSK